jgi:hypothetical protein
MYILIMNYRPLNKKDSAIQLRTKLISVCLSSIRGGFLFLNFHKPKPVLKFLKTKINFLEFWSGSLPHRFHYIQRTHGKFGRRNDGGCDLGNMDGGGREMEEEVKEGDSR